VSPCVGLTDDILTTGLGSVVIFYSVCMIESCFSCSHVAVTKLLTAPISALVLTFLTVCESRGSNPTAGSCVCHDSHTAVYSREHSVHTLTAVTRSIQSSMLMEMEDNLSVSWRL